MKSTHSTSGFTLLEVAMAMAVIALIIGGVLFGQSLIRSAQLNSVVGDVTRYTQAIQDFRDKYHALPGDFTGATALWGAANNNFTTCKTTIGTGTQTCDGDGDGRISVQNPLLPNYTTSQNEMFRAWQHLVNAGFIDGSYSGVQGPISIQHAVPGTNVPASKIPGAGYNITNSTQAEAGTAGGYFPVNYQHFLQFGAPFTSNSGTLVYPVLTTQEAQSLDSKMDDGYPGTGKVMSFPKGSAWDSNCSSNANSAPYNGGNPAPQYDSTQSGYKCSLLFLLGF